MRALFIAMACAVVAAIGAESPKAAAQGVPLGDLGLLTGFVLTSDGEPVSDAVVQLFPSSDPSLETFLRAVPNLNAPKAPISVGVVPSDRAAAAPRVTPASAPLTPFDTVNSTIGERGLEPWLANDHGINIVSNTISTLAIPQVVTRTATTGAYETFARAGTYTVVYQGNWKGSVVLGAAVNIPVLRGGRTKVLVALTAIRAPMLSQRAHTPDDDHAVFYATDRKQVHPQSAGLAYGEEPGTGFEYGHCTTTYPGTAKQDSSCFSESADTTLHLLETAEVHFGISSVGRGPRKLPRAIVFIHGFRTTFKEAIRSAQDLVNAYHRPVFVFDWASHKGEKLDDSAVRRFKWPLSGIVVEIIRAYDIVATYQPDIDSVYDSVTWRGGDGVFRRLTELEPRSIVIYAHSLGANVAIIGLAHVGAADHGEGIGGLGMVAGAVALERAEPYWNQVLKVVPKAVNYASNADLALLAAKLLNKTESMIGQNSPGLARLRHLILVDARSACMKGEANHVYFLDRSVLHDFETFFLDELNAHESVAGRWRAPVPAQPPFASCE